MICATVPPEFYQVLVDEADRRDLDVSQMLVQFAIEGAECLRRHKDRS
jgi:hypothetical protein